MQERDLPADLADRVEDFKEQINEQIAENDEDLMEKYFEGQPFTKEEMAMGMRKAITAASIMPVFVGSAQENLGVSFTLDTITQYFPRPLDGHPVTAVRPDGEKVQLHSEEDGPLAAFVFKTFVDPFVGRISLFRVFSGSLKNEGTVYNGNQEKDERLIGLNFQNGKKQQSTEVIVAGDIGAIAKLDDTVTLDTLTGKASPWSLRRLTCPSPA